MIESRNKAMSSAALDFVVIGGGVAGCYIANRLWTAARECGKRLDLRLCEATERIGGRIHSIRLKQAPDAIAEMGAIAYFSAKTGNPLRTGHRLVERLLSTLSLPVAPFPFGDEKNPLFLRGLRCTRADIAEGRVPYDVTDDERKHLANLLGHALEKILPGASSLSDDALWQMRSRAVFRDNPLFQYELGELLPLVLSPEALSFLRARTPLRWNITCFNAAEAIFELTSNDLSGLPLWYVPSGYQQLPLGLADVLPAETILLRHRLESLERIDGDARSGYLLRFAEQVEPLRAKTVILALPYHPLHSLVNRSQLFHEPAADCFRTDLEAVTPAKVYREIHAHADPWWQKASIRSGPVIHETAPCGQALLRSEGNSHLMTLGFFDVSGQERQRLVQELDPESLHARDRVAFEQSFGLSDIPAPLERHGHFWSGAYHPWRKDRPTWLIQKRMLKPIPEESIFVCGETYSDAQGWAEGALRTAEAICTRHLGLEPLPV